METGFERLLLAVLVKTDILFSEFAEYQFFLLEEVHAPKCKREQTAMHMHTKAGNCLVAAEVISAV